MKSLGSALDQDNTNIIGQRLKYEMKKRGMNSTELAKHADVKTSFLYDVISGKSANPSTVKLARVADVLGVNLSYLVDADVTVPSPYASNEDYVSIPRLGVEMSGEMPRITSMVHENEAYQFHKNWVAQHLGSTTANLRSMSMRGDSMEPAIYQNDYMLIDIAQTSPSTPGIFIVFDGIGLAVKRLEYLAGDEEPRIKLFSDNPHYSSYERPLAETRIIGRVVWVSHAL